MALKPPAKQTPEQQRAAQEDVLLREVDDAVRQDQYADFARSYGKPLIGALVLGLAAFGGYLYWDHRQERGLESKSETLIAGLDQLEAGNMDSASKRLGELSGQDGGVATQAALLRAGIAMEQGRDEEAAKLYAGVAADDSNPQLVRDLATLREVAANYDRLEPAAVVSRLKPLAVPGKPFFGSAGELVAMAYLDQGKRREAGNLFAAIAKDKEQSESLRSRSRQMAGLLGVDAIEDVDTLLDEIAEPAGAGSQAQ